MNIRNVIKEDIERVTSLWEQCGLIVSWNNPAKDFQRKLETSRRQFLIGELEGRAICSVMYAYDGHRGNVNYLSVLPEYQKKGYGEQMMREVEKRLLDMGCPKINLLIRNTNVDVIKFYEALGYKTDPVVCVGKRLIPDD
tara:strand:- start:18 stop:437 length:420 start_codon:yes stop_codon:yes gene_type:complete